MATRDIERPLGGRLRLRAPRAVPRVLLATALLLCGCGAAAAPRLHEPARPVYIRCAEGRYDTRALIGLSLADAERRVAARDCVVRPTEVDGVGVARTTEYLSNRIDIATEDNIVVAIVGRG